ncbi:Undecaprenyl-phosphate 4-deoxy-4-formamido-L-arabinose transferase [Streptomyces violaceorubidus]
MSQANRDVTVVVPFRDVQNYFGAFLESVAAQTALARAHVILVDNGSTDQSVAIASEFAARHANVDLVAQPEGRAGDARNMGMDMATTPYIVFWDADDIVPERSLEVLRNTIVKTRATVVVGREKYVPKPVKAPWHKYFGKNVKTVSSVVDIPDLIHSASCWNKIFDLDLLRSQGIRFGTGTAFEDAYVSQPALLLSERIALVDAPVYEYRRRGDGTSVMDTIWDLPQNYADQLVMLEYLAAMRQTLTPYQQETLERFLIRSMQGFLLRAPHVFGEADCRQLFERCRTLYWGITSEQFARSTHDTRHRLPYLALHFGDFDLLLPSGLGARPGLRPRGRPLRRLPGDVVGAAAHEGHIRPGPDRGHLRGRRRDGGDPRALLGQRGPGRTAGQAGAAGLVRTQREDPSGGEPRVLPRPPGSVGSGLQRDRRSPAVPGRLLPRAPRGVHPGQGRLAPLRRLPGPGPAPARQRIPRPRADHCRGRERPTGRRVQPALIRVRSRNGVFVRNQESFVFEPLYAVAVVVPIFNVERYLPECLDSLARQTIFDRCQVVLVDNGSSDSSAAIAAEFAARHPNVWAFVHAEGKAGGARNAGMDLVSARYITFCDSDDVLPEDALETMWRTAVKERVPLTIGRMETFPEETNWPWLRYFGKQVQVHPGIENIPEMIHGGSACHKLFDIEFIRANNIRFREGVHFEDAFFSVPAMLLADRIAMVPSTVYKYRKRAAEDSTMDKLWERTANYWDHLLLEEYLMTLRSRLSGHRQEVLNRFLVRSYQGFALRAPQVLPEEELFQLFQRARAVYTLVTPDAVLASTHDARHRVPFLAMYMNWYELFARPDQAIGGVYGRSGDLYLDVAVPSALLPLTKVSSTSVHVERIQAVPESGGVLVAGRFVLNGLPMGRPMRNRLQLWVEKSGQMVPAQQVWRSDLMATRDDLAWGGFEAVVPAGALKDGEFPLKLVFCTSGRDVSRPCMTTTAMLRGARPMKVADRWVLPLSKGKDNAVLVVREARGRDGDKDWEEFLEELDQDQKKRKAPFWRARAIRRATLRFYRRKEIWLIGERRDTAQDNSLHLFTYLRQHERRRKAYYIIEKGSADRAKLKRLGNVVAHSSWKHKLLMLHASLLINAYDIDSYMLPDGWDRTKYLKHLNWRIGARRVFLQHGVTDEDGQQGAADHAHLRHRAGQRLVRRTRRPLAAADRGPG